MKRIVILCLEDEPEVRDSILRDLRAFADAFRIEAAEDVADARTVLQSCTDDGDPLGLALCDHLLPGERGVDFLVSLAKDPLHRRARKMLITGQAALEDTVRAVNEANLDHYIAKPWRPEALQAAVRRQLTAYVISHEENLMPYLKVLDAPLLLEALAQRRATAE